MSYVYEPVAYGPEPIKNCFWSTTIERPDLPSLDQDHSCEVAIVGAGFTGLSAAYHLAKEGVKVSIFDAQYPGFGASGRNGGFCCLGGSMASDAQLDRRFGKDGRLAYRACERNAIELVEQLITKLNLDVDRHSIGETELAHRPQDAKSMNKDLARDHENYGVSPIYHSRDDLQNLGLNGAFYGARTIPIGFGLNPQKYAYGLLKAALAQGAKVFANSPVERIDGSSLRINGHRVTTKRVILATNGYASETLLPWLRSRFLPVQSSIIVTRPITPQEQSTQGWTSDQMAYDSRKLLHYFRLMPDGRFLFGMRGGLFATAKSEAKIRREIRENFEVMFPNWAHVETDHYWSGLVCLTRSMLPYIGHIPKSKNILIGFGYHGNGVAMATYSGALLADLAQDKTPSHLYPKALSTPPERFPFGTWRRNLLRPAYALMRMKDR